MATAFCKCSAAFAHSRSFIRSLPLRSSWTAFFGAFSIDASTIGPLAPSTTSPSPSLAAVGLVVTLARYQHVVHPGGDRVERHFSSAVGIAFHQRTPAPVAHQAYAHVFPERPVIGADHVHPQVAATHSEVLRDCTRCKNGKQNQEHAETAEHRPSQVIRPTRGGAASTHRGGIQACSGTRYPSPRPNPTRRAVECGAILHPFIVIVGMKI